MKRLHLIVLASLMACIGSSCGTGDTRAENNEGAVKDEGIVLSREQFAKGGMELGGIRREDLNTVVSVAGTIDVPPENRAILSAYHAGYIKAIPLLVGDIVRAGQVVATLENPEFVQLQQEYLEVAAQMDFLKEEYERHKILLEEQISSRKNFLQAESNYNSAMASYSGLRKKLELLQINPGEAEAGNISSSIPVRAPIGGKVSRVYASRGQFIAPSDPIMEIINKEHIHLELSVYEKDILNIQPGQAIRFTIPETSSNSYTAEVYLVGSSLDPATRTVKVHGHLDENTPPNLAIGMFVEAEIVTGTATFEVLPDEAIIRTDSGNFAWLLQQEGEGPYYFRRVEIKTGDSNRGFTEIGNSEEFPAEAKFLTKGAYSLLGESLGN